MSNIPDKDPPEWWKRLSPEQRAFIRKLTGSQDGHPNPSLEEVGRAFDETRRRIREIEDRALRKLRGDDDESVKS
jgi:DNA-directed RNA polymerase sigma subunit (sigma70/sigma32)